MADKIKIDKAATIREIARERVGQPPARKVFVDKTRRKPKYPHKEAH